MSVKTLLENFRRGLFFLCGHGSIRGTVFLGLRRRDLGFKVPPKAKRIVATRTTSLQKILLDASELSGLVLHTTLTAVATME